MPEPLQVPAPPKADPEEAQFAELKKQLFASSEPTVALVQLSKAYYDGGHPHHAAATASYGLSLGKGAAGAFKTLLGCSLSKLGLIDEASYHLKKSDSLDGLRDQCLKTLASQRGER